MVQLPNRRHHPGGSKTSMKIDEKNRNKSFIYKSMTKYRGNAFFDNNINIDDEPTVTFTTGNKRINNENLNDNLFNKRRKLSPNKEEGIIEVDFVRQPIRKGSFNTMPQQRRNDFMNSLRGNKKNNIQVNPEVIELNDNDDVDQPGSSRVIELDLTNEPTGETDCNKSLRHNTVPSSSANDLEIVGEYSLRHAEGSSGLQNSRAPAHVGRQANARNQRNKVENRLLKEINNRHLISYSDVLRKGTSSSSASSSQSTTTSFKDFSSSLSLEKLRKGNDRDTFLKLLEQYTRSPNGSKKSLSETSNVSLSDTRQSKPSTSTSTSHRYTRFPNSSLEKRSALAPSTSKSSQSMSQILNMSAVDKTVIDLTGEEDDENQRQEIVSNVISSDLIRNLKTSFVGKDKDVVEEDFIHNILKKYDAKLRLQETHANKIRKKIRDDRETFNKTLSEILEKRLTIKEHEQEEEIAEQKPSFEIAPITKAMTTAINQIVASRKSPLVQVKDTAIKLQDIRTLENCAWLNDEVINAYMNLIKMRAETKLDKYPKVHCFNTFLYEQLQKKGYNSVRRWTKKIDIFDYSMLIVPIHLGNHWCLIQMKIKEKSIRYFDSMGSPNNSCLKAMLQYLVDEYKDKKNGELNTKEWQLINLPSNEIPQQRNMHDCGVFACTFAEHLTRLAPFNFSQDHMPYFRVKMMYEILTGELLL